MADKKAFHKKSRTINVDELHPRDWPKDSPYRAIRFNDEQVVNIFKTLGVPTPLVLGTDQPAWGDVLDLAMETVFLETKGLFLKFCDCIPWDADPLQTEPEYYILLESHGEDYTMEQARKVAELMGTTEKDIIPVRIVG